MFFPKRFPRVLTSKVELAPAAKILNSIKDKREAVMIEIPQDEKAIGK